ILSINEDSAVRIAAYRNAFNAHQGSLVAMAHAERLTLATDRLAYFAHWITPEGMPKRYDTHFFLAIAPAEQEAPDYELETSEGIWIQPSMALERFQRGSFPIAFPTFHQLRDLSAFSNVQEVLRAAAARYVPTHMPVLMRKDGRPHVYLPEDPAN